LTRGSTPHNPHNRFCHVILAISSNNQNRATATNLPIKTMPGQKPPLSWKGQDFAMPCSFRLLTVFLMLVISQTAAAADDRPLAAQSSVPSFQLADLEQMALTSNPTLAQAAAQIDVARGKALQAGLYPNPTIGYQAELIGVRGPNGNSTPGEFQGGFVQQTIITAGKLRLSRAKYNQEACEAEFAAMGQQLRVLNGVRMRFYELLALQRMMELRRDLLTNAEENLRTTREMFNTGLANEADTLLAVNEVNRAKIDLTTQENQHASLWQHLIALMGNPHLPVSPLSGQLELECAPLEWDACLSRLLAESPEVLAARAHVIHDQIMVKRERVEPIPNISIQAGPGYNFETPGTNVNVQVSVKVPLFDRNQGTIRQAQAELARSIAGVERIELSLRQRLAESFNRYRTALLTAQLYRDANIPNARKAYEIQVDMYKKRRIAWPEVVKLQRNLFQEQSEYTHALLDLRRAEVAICGLLMVDGLSPPMSPVPGGHLEALPKPR
jgi:cobalt-zinc-cadmium efflux system outer membrane protein